MARRERSDIIQIQICEKWKHRPFVHQVPQTDRQTGSDVHDISAQK